MLRSETSLKILAMLNTTIAHYKITAKLGEGGMGAVYRATDTKLGREVAIKVLPEAFAQDKERLARFEREAKALAQLNHPNVGSIYGFDQDKGHYFLVLELIEGDTLQERLRKGPMPVEEGLKVFQQIAEALEAAHEKDIVHRDLKPANLKIDPHGRVKVLDFGLAKARFSDTASDDPGSSSADSMAPTITSEFTMPGKVMGTAAYMSPEQSRGQEVDRRTDVWAFGCCLFEALTGKKPFTGATTSDLLADILKSDPDFTVIPPETPSEVLTLLRRSLEKDPRRRLRDLGDIALTLEDVTETSRIQSSRITQMDAAPVHSQSLVEPGWKRLLSVGKTVGNIVLALGFSYAVWTLVFDREKPDARSAIRSIAVLPFSFSGSDTNVSDVAEWLPHDIQGTLVSVDVFDLVPAWSLSSAYSAETKPAAAAADLKVQAVVQGLVRVQGNEITVNLELIDGASGQQLWNGSFPIKGGDIEGLKMEIVLQLLRESLQRPLSLEERARLGTPKKVNAQAYIAFQQGLKYFDKYTRDGFEKAEAKFDEAIEIDPSFGAPYAFRIHSIWVPTIWGGTTISAAEVFGRASSLLEDSRSFLRPADIFLLEGWIAMIGRWDWPEATAGFERAMETGVRSAESFQNYSIYLTLVEARYGDALRMIKRAIELNPDRFNNLNQLAQVHFARGEYRLGIEQYDEIPDLPWAHLRAQSEAYAQLGELEEALNLIRQAEELSEQHASVIMVKASIFAQMGRAEEARLLMDEIRSKRDAGLYIQEAWFAPVYFHLGEMEQALSSIEDGFEQKGNWAMVELRYHKNLKMFSNEPRYWAVVEKMNFPALPISHSFHDKEQEMRYGRPPAVN